jgi:hypothetical protein
MMVVIHLNRLAPYQGIDWEQREQFESNYLWELSHGEGRRGRSQTSEAQPSEKINGGTAVGYSWRIALRRDQCGK